MISETSTRPLKSAKNSFEVGELQTLNPAYRLAAKNYLQSVTVGFVSPLFLVNRFYENVRSEISAEGPRTLKAEDVAEMIEDILSSWL
ncbi:hypothetical protein Nepgr_001047 [Nepenthes gracilis]|uniref:Uncharacterized protein n=1 Tax=Nepenthes gracilis TaxID=150966 RepID=A0AAD3RXA6_NEPGR|nr:hypothetical protein Nepgr_001047 [Nepenthes gracilis]